jgi:hypothetical protein
MQFLEREVCRKRHLGHNTRAKPQSPATLQGLYMTQEASTVQDSEEKWNWLQGPEKRLCKSQIGHVFATATDGIRTGILAGHGTHHVRGDGRVLAITHAFAERTLQIRYFHDGAPDPCRMKLEQATASHLIVGADNEPMFSAN